MTTHACNRNPLALRHRIKWSANASQIRGFWNKPSRWRVENVRYRPTCGRSTRRSCFRCPDILREYQPRGGHCLTGSAVKQCETSQSRHNRTAWPKAAKPWHPRLRAPRVPLLDLLGGQAVRNLTVSPRRHGLAPNGQAVAPRPERNLRHPQIPIDFPSPHPISSSRCDTR
jgi:hypothetical protein